MSSTSKNIHLTDPQMASLDQIKGFGAQIRSDYCSKETLLWLRVAQVTDHRIAKIERGTTTQFHRLATREFLSVDVNISAQCR